MRTYKIRLLKCSGKSPEDIRLSAASDKASIKMMAKPHRIEPSSHTV